MKNESHQIYNNILIQLATEPRLNSSEGDSMNRTLMEVLANTLDAERVCLWSLQSEQLHLESENSYSRTTGKHSKLPQLNLRNLPDFFHVIRTSRYLDIFNLSQDERVKELVETTDHMTGVKSTLLIPLRSGGALSGLLHVDQTRSRRIWINDEIQFACQVADLAAMNTQHFDIRYRERQLDHVLAFARDLEGKFDFFTLGERFAAYLAGALQAEHVLIFKTDPHHRKLWVVNQYSAPPGYEKLYLDYRQGAAGMCADHGRVIEIEDYSTFKVREEIYDQFNPFQAVLVEPIIRKGKTVYVLQAMRKESNKRFRRLEARVMQQMAAWFGMLVDQTLLTERISSLIEYRKTLNHILETSHFVSGVPDLINTVLDYCLPVLKTRMAIVLLEEHVVIRGLPGKFEEDLSLILNGNQAWRSAPVVIFSMEQAAQLHPIIVEAFQETDIQAFILAPVMIEDIRLGYFLVASSQCCEWKDDDVALVEIAAKHLGMEARRVKTFVENQQRANLTWRLNNISLKFSHILSYAEAVQVVGNAAVEIMQPDHAFILLRSPQKTLVNAFSYAIPDWTLQQIIETEGNELENIFLCCPYPFLIQNIMENTFPRLFGKYLLAEDICSIKALPFLYQEQTIGMVIALYEDPQTWPEYEQEMMMIFARSAVLTLQNAWMYEELEKGYLELALVLADAMETRETSISGISMRIANWAETTARHLGCSEEEIRDIRWAAMLHDIGKSEIPDQVIHKPGPLSKEEWNIVQKAPTEGEKIIRPLQRYRPVGNIIRSFHERFDGSGYPDNLKEREIPIGARILAVAEAYGSMIDQRAYRKALKPHEALEEIRNNSGTQFDPRVVEAFITAIPAVV
jgi:HD-GYP domain-containing protein (c-di-GMP phosphodiesterase class II)